MQNLTPEIITKISQPLPDNGVGAWLRYDPVYDQIRKNRIEEDDGTQREAWEAELKHADWQEVEKLCLEVLCEKSKDLQIISWFIEAHLQQNGLKGLLDSTSIFLDFTKQFWENAYPQKTEDPDQTLRVHIVEAMLRNAQTIIITNPLEELKILFSQPPSLADCYEADSLEKVAKRGGAAADAFQKAIENGLISMDRVRKAFHEVNKTIGEEKAEFIDKCVTKLQETDKILRDSIGNDAPRFSELIDHLTELKGLYKLCARESSANNESATVSEKGASLSDGNIAEGDAGEKTNEDKVSDRSGVYKGIRDIAQFLFELDPHSPSPVLLRIIGGWENKNLAEIIADLQNAPSEVKSLINLMSNACQKNNNPTP
jgi:type VI secretion system protein ImpA